MEERSRSVFEAATALGVLALIGLITVLGIGISVPQKPPPTPTPIEAKIVIPTPVLTTPIPPTPTPIPPPQTFNDVASAQKIARFQILVPSTLPPNVRVDRVDVQDNNMFQSLTIYYIRDDGKTMELFETESSPNTFFLRYYLTDPNLKDRTSIRGEPAIFESSQQGYLRLFWSSGDQIFGIRDQGWGLTRDALKQMAETLK